MKNKLLGLVLPLVFLACAKPDPTNLENKTKREIEIENENIRKKAEAIEVDLERRQRFFSSLDGTFVGTFTVGGKLFETQMTFIPSLPPYQSGRSRTIEEITSDINNLFFTVQVTHINKEDERTIGGCIINQVKPNFDAGQVMASDENCSSVYLVSLYSSSGSKGDLISEKPTVPEKSKDLAQKVLNKQIEKVNEIFVVMKPTLLENSFLMALRRVEKK